MQKAKWIFFIYLAFIGLIVAAIGASFTVKPPRDANTLYSTYGVNLKSLDPAICNDVVGSNIIGNVYECLYGYKFGVVPYEMYPQLAAEMPQISDDGLTYTIKLRKGIHFYDPYQEAFKDGTGPEVKAADLIYSWKRVADFKVASPNFSTLFQEKIAGIDEWNAYTEKVTKEGGTIDYDRPVEGLAAPDEHTLRIKLTKPAPQFKFLMAYLGSAAVCRPAVEYYGERFKNRPVGTGPYVLQDHRPEQRILFLANPVYRGRPDVDGGADVPPALRMPKITRLQYDYFKETIPVWHRFQEGLYDIASIPKETYALAINPDTRELTPAMVKKGIRLVKGPDPSIFYYGFNMNDPVVGKNKPLRQAMALAFNRAQYIRVYQNGRGIVPNGPIPAGFPTYADEPPAGWNRFDLGAAKKKAAEAQEASRAINGRPVPPLTLLMPDSDTPARQEAEYFSIQMRQIGLEIKAEYTTWARYQEMVDARETQVFAGGWAADYPDEQTFLQLFYGKFAPAGGVNPTAYNNPAFDALYEKAMVMNPSPARDALYREMCAIVNEDCPWVYLYYPLTYTLHYDWLQGYNVMDYGSGMRQYLSLDAARRASVLGAR